MLTILRPGHRPDNNSYYSKPDDGGTDVGTGTGSGDGNGNTGSTSDGGGNREGNRNPDREGGTTGNGNERSNSADGTSTEGSAVGVGNGVRGEVQSDSTGTPTGGRRRSRERIRNTGDSSTGDAAGSAGGTENGESRISPLAELDLKQDKPRSVKPQIKSLRSKKSSSKPGDIDSSELGKFVQGLFGVAAVIGGAHWIIDEDESSAISDPLSNMLNKMNKKKKDALSATMAPLLLATAIGSVIVPRAMISIQQIKLERARLEYERTNPFPIRQDDPAANHANDNGGEAARHDGTGIIPDGEAALARIHSTIPASD